MQFKLLSFTVVGYHRQETLHIIKGAVQWTLIRSLICLVFIFRLMSTLKLVWFVISVLKNFDSTRIMGAAVVHCLLLRAKGCLSRRRISKPCNKGSDIDQHVLASTSICMCIILLISFFYPFVHLSRRPLMKAGMNWSQKDI